MCQVAKDKSDLGRLVELFLTLPYPPYKEMLWFCTLTHTATRAISPLTADASEVWFEFTGSGISMGCGSLAENSIPCVPGSSMVCQRGPEVQPGDWRHQEPRGHLEDSDFGALTL